MKIELTTFIQSMSAALDFAEAEIIQASRNHGKRVGVISNLMAVKAGMGKEEVFALTQAAVLHDCALAEYLNDELSSGCRSLDELKMADHCIAGENMLLKLPVYRLVQGAVLYHHERADGKGALGKTDAETPLAAQIIHLADVVDVVFSLETVDPEKYRAIMEWLELEKGKTFSEYCGDLFRSAVSYEAMCSITGENCRAVLRTMLPPFPDEVSTEVLREMSSFFARITDYKSHFTWRHSLGVAEKAEAMGRFWGYDDERCDKLYIAGGLHDIGKLFISNDILEKPAKLTSEEYKEIQNHAQGTWNMLHTIGGLEEITRWAALHHEKLDGSGYPFGYLADSLGRIERMMACIDIYQALVEERPYKQGLPHHEAMEILRKMGDAGQLDNAVLDDIDACFAPAAQKEKAVELELPELKNEAWRCPVCGYIYEGDLPEDFICPQCEQPGSIFERVH